ARIAPGGSTGDDLFSTCMGEQIGLVLQGTLELWVEDQVMLLRAGDSFCYASRTPRRWRNPGSDVAEVIWAISRIDYQEASPYTAPAGRRHGRRQTGAHYRRATRLAFHNS